MAVVSVMIDSSKENGIISGIWHAIPDNNKSGKSSIEVDIDIAKLLPKNKPFVSYAGSMTTLPCRDKAS